MINFFFYSRTKTCATSSIENFISRKSYKSSSQLPLPVYWLRSVMHTRSRFSKYGFTTDERRRTYFNFSQFYLSLFLSLSPFVFYDLFLFPFFLSFFRYTLFLTISDFFAHLSLSRFSSKEMWDKREREREREYNLIRSKSGMIEFFEKI